MLYCSIVVSIGTAVTPEKHQGAQSLSQGDLTDSQGSVEGPTVTWPAQTNACSDSAVTTRLSWLVETQFERKKKKKVHRVTFWIKLLLEKI